MNLLLEDISLYVTLDPKEQELLLTYFEAKTYKAKTILLNEGETSNYLYFINKGIVRNYVLDRNDMEYLFRIADNAGWISSFKSFNNHTPSDLCIEIIEDAEVLQISFENFDLLTQAIPKIERYFRILISEQYTDLSDRIKDSLTLTAEENYKQFIKKYPSLANRMAQKHIASYIGVTPSFFSRMKAKMLKK